MRLPQPRGKPCNVMERRKGIGTARIPRHRQRRGVQWSMGYSTRGLMLCVLLAAFVFLAQASAPQSLRGERPQTLQPEAEQLLALANESRAAHGAGPLRWDPALAAAARQHCLRMAAEGPISHRYGDEPDVSERAGQAGAHFSLIEENVAIGPDPATIHEEWMHSSGHRTNLLNPEVDGVGLALVASRGVLYAVADYERAVPVMTQTQVEFAVAGLVRARGIVTFTDPAEARAYCDHSQGIKGIVGGGSPTFLMRWQNTDITQLPAPLLDHLSPRQYRKAAVGSCPAQGAEGTFTSYRVAVFLY
jgi:hypothetical protein